MRKLFKKCVSVAVLMAMGTSLLITSCTNRETEEPKEAVSAISQPEIITQLEAFNATLGATGTRMPLNCPHTPGQELCWKCWLKILMRDVWGAYDGAMHGPRLPAMATPPLLNRDDLSTESAIIIGAGSSYMGCIRRIPPTSDSENFPREVKSKTFSAAYAKAKDMVKETDYVLGRSIGLDNNSSRIGILHNKILDCVEDVMEKDNEDALLGNLTSEERNLLNSNEFITAFDKIVNTTGQSAYEDSTTISSTSELILEVFEKALNQSEMDKTIIMNIISEYVAIVKNSDELSNKEKGCLYVSFAVAWYSYHYWENWNLTHRYVD